jgi:geranylgeranyl diphosphate synthase type II
MSGDIFPQRAGLKPISYKFMTLSIQKFSEIFQKYQSLIEAKIALALPKLGREGPLLEASRYALLSGGKRFRPALVLMVADSLGKGHDATAAALAVEYFHTASLIADDLPCMDDDSERRNKPALHKVYGEAVALLVSYGLIAAGYGAIAENSQENSGEVLKLALDNATHNTGFFGATGGQQIDLFPPEISYEILVEVIEKKTISLFELAFVLGWLFGGGKVEDLQIVKQAAYSLGMAFQVADDIVDYAQDRERGSSMNMAALLGREEAKNIVERELAAFVRHLKQLGLGESALVSLVDAVRGLQGE